MTPEKFLARTLSAVCPGAYLAHKPGKAPPLPWFVYKRASGEEYYADNTNYARLPRFRVQLLFEENDTDLVEAFEAALSELGTWRLYDADYLDSEACLFHDYRLSLGLDNLKEANEREASDG